MGAITISPSVQTYDWHICKAVVKHCQVVWCNWDISKWAVLTSCCHLGGMDVLTKTTAQSNYWGFRFLVWLPSIFISKHKLVKIGLVLKFWWIRTCQRAVCAYVGWIVHMTKSCLLKEVDLWNKTVNLLRIQRKLFHVIYSVLLFFFTSLV